MAAGRWPCSWARVQGAGTKEWNLEPQGTMKFAAHLFKTGTLKTQPKAWTDYYLPSSADLKGN